MAPEMMMSYLSRRTGVSEEKLVGWNEKIDVCIHTYLSVCVSRYVYLILFLVIKLLGSLFLFIDLVSWMYAN
jgi:hypothetical protein